LSRSAGDGWQTVVDGDDSPEGEIKAHHLAANSVTAGAIAAGAVKADAIDVDELSAISADLGTVTAGIVQTPDGRARFGEGALGSGKHGMLVSNGTQDRVAVGDISGRMWRGQPLPQGTYGIYVSKGAGYFAGELDAEIIRSENIDIAFAQVFSVIGDGNWSIEHVATSKDDWNIVKGENALKPNTN